MKQFDREISNVQNPAIGAAILWRFVYGYYKRDYKSVPFPLLFVVLPIVFREDLCIVINSTQQASGFSKVSEKLFKGFSNDRLLSVNNAALSMRELTLQSFNIGMAANLYSMDFDTAYVFPLRQTNRSGLSYKKVTQCLGKNGRMVCGTQSFGNMQSAKGEVLI